MSKKNKIGDVFKLPMIIEGQCCVMSADFRYQINLDDSDSNVSKQAECICEAINNHDRLIEENKRIGSLLKGVVIEFDSDHLDGDAYGLMCGIKQLISELGG